MGDQNMEDDGEIAMPVDECISKPDGSEKESTQVLNIHLCIIIAL